MKFIACFIAMCFVCAPASAGCARFLDAVVTGPDTPPVLSGPLVESALRADVRTQNLPIMADAYHGLVVLHGVVHSVYERDNVLRVVYGVRGVERVYNFTQIDRDPDNLIRDINAGERYMVGLSTVNYVPQPDYPAIGLLPGPTELAKNVKINMDADAVAGEFNIMVDNYEDLIILHGHLPDESAKGSAESAAAHTYGVAKVFSYIVVEREEAVPAVYEWPVLVNLTRPELEHRAVRPKNAR